MGEHHNSTILTMGSSRRIAAVVVPLLAGCMTIMTRQEPDVSPRVYAGTILDLKCVVNPADTLPVIGWCVLDLPFSLVADTLLLPLTIPEQIALNRKKGFIVAGANGDMARARELIEAHPDLAHEHYQSHPLLSIAAATGQTEFVALLLEHGADVNVGDASEKTPLHCAIHPGSVLSLLPEEIADRTVSETGYSDVVRLLRAHGARE